MKEEGLQRIFKAEQVRHIYGHNSGKVDASYIRKTKKKNLPINEYFQLIRILY